MGKRVAILQSNYIPWKGTFDLINSVDEFILYDTAQFTKNDWRNRNKIKTPRGVAWLSIPVKHNFGQTIHETLVGDSTWAQGHWDRLRQCYGEAPHFRDTKPLFEDLYKAAAAKTNLSAINHCFLSEICSFLNIKTKISWSRDYHMIDGQTDRLVDLCQQAHATEYISGPAAKDYIEESAFRKAGIALRYVNYTGYPEYRQLYPPFEHGVSILDLIFNEGPEAKKYMKTFAPNGPDIFFEDAA